MLRARSNSSNMQQALREPLDLTLPADLHDYEKYMPLEELDREISLIRELLPLRNLRILAVKQLLNSNLDDQNHNPFEALCQLAICLADCIHAELRLSPKSRVHLCQSSLAWMKTLPGDDTPFILFPTNRHQILHFGKADVLTKVLAESKSERAKAVLVGKFLGQSLNCPVPILVDGRNGIATLRVEQGRSKSKLYHFEVQWDAVLEPPSPVPLTVGQMEQAAVEQPRPSTIPTAGLVGNSSKIETEAIDPLTPSESHEAKAPPREHPESKQASGNDEVWE